MPAEPTISAAAGASLAELARRLTEAKGTVIGMSGPVVVSQPEEDAFAALIGDWDPMHNDPTWHTAGSDGPIVLGFHVLARLEDIVRGCAFMEDAAAGLEVLTIGLNHVRFPAPFPVGATAQIEVSVTDVTVRDGGVVLTTAHRCSVGGSGKPTMVAQHVAFLSAGPADGAERGLLPAGETVAVADIPASTGVVPGAPHDDRFFAALTARSGEWLGTTPWTSISDREAHAFALLCGGTGRNGASQAHPFAGRPVPRLHLLALRAYFSPQVGLPVLTDESMMAFNYGVDSACWRGTVVPGTRLRDHVQLKGIQARAPGDHLVTTRHVLEADGDPHGVLVADCKTLYRSTT